MPGLLVQVLSALLKVVWWQPPALAVEKKLDFTVIIIIIINHNWKITKLILLKINVAWVSRLSGIKIFSVLLGKKVAYFIPWQKTADFETITLEKTVPEGYRRQQTYVIRLYPFLMGSEKSQKQKKVTFIIERALGKSVWPSNFAWNEWGNIWLQRT